MTKFSKLEKRKKIKTNTKSRDFFNIERHVLTLTLDVNHVREATTYDLI